MGTLINRRSVGIRRSSGLQRLVQKGPLSQIQRMHGASKCKSRRKQFKEVADFVEREALTRPSMAAETSEFSIEAFGV